MKALSLTKTAALLALALITTAATSTPQQTQSLKIQQFDNADVNVWKSIVIPNAPLVMHTHEHPRVIVALAGGTMKIVFEDGKSEIHQWETGKAYWLSKEEGKRRHADVNTGTKPIEVMVVELKDAR